MPRSTLPRVAAPLVLAALLGAGALAAQPTVRLPAQDRPLAGRATQVFAIGAEEGQSWEMLSNVEDVVFDRADNLYVLDRGNERVLVFDRTGRFLRQIGKEGDGPGEFRLPRSLAVMSDGHLAVLDVIHRNISIFGPDGSFRRTAAWEPEWGLPFGKIETHPAGGVVGVLRPAITFPGESGARTSGPRVQRFAHLSLSRDAEPTHLYEITDPMQIQSSSSGGGEGTQQIRTRVMGPPEFAPQTLWGVLPDGGTVLSHTTLYTLKIQDPAGKTVRFIQRPVPVRRTTERDKELARQRMRERMKSREGVISVTIGGGRGRAGGPPPRMAGPTEAQIEEQIRTLQFADTIRALQAVRVAPSGKLWIERTAQNVYDPGPIDVVTPQGEYLGTLRNEKLPRAISASGRAAYVERDEMGVERVVVKQLPAGWR